MTTRPLPPPPVVPDDPGPWAVVSHVRRALAHRPDRRRPPTPTGLLIASPPTVPVATVGLDPSSTVAGAGPIRLVAAGRGIAHGLAVSADGDEVVGVSRGVRRRWRLHDLSPLAEERPPEDPAGDLPDPVPLGALADVDLDAWPRAPGGALVALAVAAGRLPALALVRAGDRGLVRWIAGARAAAWTDDGGSLVFGGDWGIVLATRA
jgi:hypothetical protein